MIYTRFFSNKWAIAGFTGLLYSTFGSESSVLKVGNTLKGEISHSNRENSNIKPQYKSLETRVPFEKGDYLPRYMESGNNIMTMDIIDATEKLSLRLIDHKSGKQTTS